jgi:hypothetical protein
MFSKNLAVDEIMWKSVVEPDRPQMTIWPMRIACWIPNTTKTHSECIIVIVFALQKWLHERASVVSFTCIVCIFIESLISKVIRHENTDGVSASSSVAVGSSS